MFKTLEELLNTIRDRKKNPSETSYTNKLLNNKELSKKKIIEELSELIEAVEKNTNKVHETADVIYHLIVFLEVNNINIEDVMSELEKRKK
ncbi:MAG: phosphoribosyl-ATP diphosphatase [Pelagibacteraceae bacterium TMED246]|nr:MAG: phosphoribosyl-ATP diphosphatase [Pelagibacteraceae bacterium TMED246]|tara:strand:+ start:33659 stop:33931 length:273 start_codon:yes stop_codon:yes gene_type:complete